VLWDGAMEKQLTDDVLKAYFEANKREFDGSEVRASHILFRSAKSADGNATTALLRDATAVREQIETGKLTFAEAAAKYSTGPSREKGGDLGFLPRHGLMVDAFSRAAFALEKGKISLPVVSPFGVHLIMVTDIRNGTKTWEDVREELKPPAAQALFDKIAKRERDKAAIQFLGPDPHFKPGTRELIEPEQGGK
jgi:parvulin-like peptidyl-prolyl isomerase